MRTCRLSPRSPMRWRFGSPFGWPAESPDRDGFDHSPARVLETIDAIVGENSELRPYCLMLLNKTANRPITKTAPMFHRTSLVTNVKQRHPRGSLQQSPLFGTIQAR